MLETLEQRHEELLAVMTTMRGLIANDALDREMVTRTRLGLSKASAARTRFLAEKVYPSLLSTLAGGDAALVRQLQADAANDRARSSAHVSKWNAHNIAQDWRGFRRNAATILTIMETRIAWEKRVLYSLMIKAKG